MAAAFRDKQFVKKKKRSLGKGDRCDTLKLYFSKGSFVILLKLGYIIIILIILKVNYY